MQPSRSQSPFRAAFAAVLLGSLAAALLLLGCAKTPASDSSVPPPPQAPPPWVLDSPKAAVSSYLQWISFAYRIGRSDVASATFTPYEEVRVDSYVQYNKEQGRLIDQKLTDLRFKSLNVVDGTATVAAHEEWRYRYISVKTGAYSGPPLTVSYESTYTLALEQGDVWRVDKVEASATTPVK